VIPPDLSPDDSPRRPRPLAHPGIPCGDRCDPPCGRTDLAPYRAAEKLRNHDTICHLCHAKFRPTDPVVCGGWA
jgi:hypothetical protein